MKANFELKQQSDFDFSLKGVISVLQGIEEKYSRMSKDAYENELFRIMDRVNSGIEEGDVYYVQNDLKTGDRYYVKEVRIKIGVKLGEKLKLVAFVSEKVGGEVFKEIELFEEGAVIVRDVQPKNDALALWMKIQETLVDKAPVISIGGVFYPLGAFFLRRSETLGPHRIILIAENGYHVDVTNVEMKLQDGTIIE